MVYPPQGSCDPRLDGVFNVSIGAPMITEPTTVQDLSLSITTVEGIPPVADLAAGTITITRVRAGVEAIIVNAAVCAAVDGRIFYDYTFPAVSWQVGDGYKAVFNGQRVIVNGVTHALPEIRCKGVMIDAAAIMAGIAATVAGRLQEASTTTDLNQAAASYDLFTGTTQVVILESLVIQMPNIVAGGALTSISIQTDDATPAVIIDNITGAVANLTAEAQLSWQGVIRIPVGTRIQLTINGGAHGVAYVCNVNAQYRAVVAGGTLT